MPLSPGDRFDRYVIEEPLGEGGMARVYRAHDPRLHRGVALKVLRIDSSTDPNAAHDAHGRVLREARAAAALDHPNAVSVFDVGEADGELFIAMELVVGKSLRSYVGDPGVAWDVKLRWMVDAARALGAAHERGLVHRDVKPENIMVRADGVVKVLDFGIAKRVVVDVQSVGGADDVKSQSLQGAVVGTPWYLSPEQLRGDPVDGRADQFAWGVTTYELLTGQLPWPKGVEGFQLVLAILDRMPEPPSARVEMLPSIVDAAVMKTLAKTPSQRFEAMEFVVTALEGLASSSRRSWVDVPAATTKTDPAPPPGALPPPTEVHTPPLDSARTLSSHKPPVAPRLRRPATVAVGVMVAAAVTALVSARLTRRPQPPRAAAVAPPAATAVTDLPPPTSPVPAAVAEFRDYQRSFRDADWNAAMKALETAVELDPTMGAAYLRLAFARSIESIDEGRVRSTFLQALVHRATLSERDAALLDALEPYLQREPSDPLECEHRLAQLRARYPLDAEIAYFLGSVRYDRGDIAAAVDAFDAAIAIDPRFVQAWSSRAGCLAYVGRFDDARDAIQKALSASPTATEPLWYSAELDEQSGRCGAEEADVRQWLSRDPDDWFAYLYLARALAAEGKPPDSVRAALEQKWARLDADRRELRAGIDRALLDLVSGDFASAQKNVEGAEAKAAAEPGAQAHAETAALLLRIAEETGRADRVRDVAQAYLARRDAWTPPHRVDDTSIRMDPVPEMLGALARVGAISQTQLSDRRREWLRAWRAKTGPAFVGLLWLAGWASTATTAEDAKAALAARGEYEPLPPFTPYYPGMADVGHAYLLAGRTADAVVALRHAVSTCTQLEEPVAYVRAWLELGTALEQQGDTAGACKAYRAVLDRWGHARPRSLTADRARARSTALGCR